MTILNKDFCHQYAYASRSEHERNGNMSYRNGVMYSYGTALAKKLDNCTLYNKSKYSTTTSAQQTCLINALSGKIIYLDGLDMGFDFRNSEIVAGLTHCYKKSVEDLSKAKHTSTKERYTAEIYQIQKTLNELLEYKVLTKKDLNSELKALLKGNFDVEKLVKVKKQQQEKEERARLQRLEQQRQDYTAEIADFRAGSKNNISYGARDLVCGGFDIIRLVNGDEILTSQGISVPLEHALFLFEAAKKQKELGKSKSDFCFKIRDTFLIDRIEANGDCFVGCHKFKFEEISRCYKEEYKK